MIKINVLTLFPDVFKPHLDLLPFNRAIQQNILDINLVNLRDFAVDNRGSVDDKPYGGGTGMIMRVEPVVEALKSINTGHKILLSPRGQTFNQNKAKELSQMETVTLICGRYEGIDARIEKHYVDETISIGDYVLSGGETAAIAIMEATIRLMEGIFDKDGVVEQESFSNYHLEHPQYTRPEDFEGHKVPEVLLSGNHKKIDLWKKENSTTEKMENLQ